MGDDPRARGEGFADGRYRVVELLGSGGMAMVWRVYDLDTGRDLAIKVLDASLGSDPWRHDRLIREGRIAASLDHPNVIEVVDSFFEFGRPCVVMELAAGSAARWVERHGPAPASLVASEMAAIAEALHVAHEAGIVHRDVKPDNLLIDGQGRLKLSDFGIAQMRSGSTVVTATGAFMGSVAFMAPEQRSDAKQVGPAADLYAVGATILWLCTAELPVDLNVPERRRELLSALPAPLSDVVERATRYEPHRRHGCGQELAAALRASVEGQPDASTTFAVGDDTLRRRARVLGPQGTLPGGPEVEGRSRLGHGPWIAALVLGLFAGAMVGGWPDVSERTDTPSIEACADPFRHSNTRHFPGSSAQGLGPRETATATLADLDDDGFADAVFVNPLDENVSIYWGDGSASLVNPTLVPIGRSHDAPAVADFDEDGHKDMLFAVPDQGVLALVRGEPDRTFSPPIHHDQAAVPRAPVAVDWNKDGHVDVLFRRNLDRGINWRAGDGRGGFSPHTMLRYPTSYFHGVDLLGPQFSEVVSVAPDGEIRHIYEDPRTNTVGVGSWGRAPSFLRDARWMAGPRDPRTGGQALFAHLKGVGTTYRAYPSKDSLGPFCEFHDGISDLVHFGYFNADPHLDAVRVQTCAFCSSNHSVFLGQAGPPSE